MTGDVDADTATGTSRLLHLTGLLQTDFYLNVTAAVADAASSLLADRYSQPCTDNQLIGATECD